MHGIRPQLDTLAGLFYPSLAELGAFVELPVGQLPESYRRLLAHTGHMTVTVEGTFGSPVDVRVLQVRATPTHYAREILLARQDTGAIVQYGIMRVAWAYVSPEVRREIESESTPLGRILDQHDVLRSVQLYDVWQVTPASSLAKMFGPRGDRPTYGRTALIEFAGDPAIELVEIVAPLETP